MEGINNKLKSISDDMLSELARKGPDGASKSSKNNPIVSKDKVIRKKGKWNKKRKIK